VSSGPRSSTPSATRSPAPGATTTPFVYRAEPVSIETGTYLIPASEWSIADFTVTIPEGWAVQYGHVFLKHSDASDELGFYAVVPDDVYADVCEGDGDVMDVGTSVDDLAAALLEQSGATANGPVDTTLGGYPAVRIDLTVPRRLDLKTCRLEGFGLQIWYSSPADKYFVLLPDGIASVFILDVDGRRQVFVTQYRSGASGEDVRELQAILDSIHIEA
jgi:hypothetical protein